MRTVAILTVSPKREWMEFLNTFTHYTIYMIIDDNTKDYNEIYGKVYPRIHFIQIDEKECRENGFVNSCSTVSGMKDILAWDKALYYFSTLYSGKTKLKDIWLIEDDVFFYEEKTLLSIDEKYKGRKDILMTGCYERIDDGWLWSRIDIQYPQPHYCSMVCAIRINALLLTHIKEYANKHKTIFFIEALFPTIARQYHFKVKTIEELRSIVYRKEWDIDTVNTKGLFHPVKNIKEHDEFRHRL